jgi:hypothetical protein
VNGSASTNAVITALAKALPTLEAPKKSRTVTMPGRPPYSYAELDEIIRATRPGLAAHGLAVTQEAVNAEGAVGIVTRVVHVSGEWVEFGPLLFALAGGPQQAGSALTYARRYALTAALGITAEDDDDATSAQVSRAGPVEVTNLGEVPAAARGAVEGSGGPPVDAAGGPPDFRLARTAEAGELGDRLVSELAVTVPDQLRALADKGFFSPQKLAAVRWYLDRAAG